MVEENERSDIPPRVKGQEAADSEAAYVALAGLDDQVDCVGHWGVSRRALRETMDEAAPIGKVRG
jgi:hypothetical protein